MRQQLLLTFSFLFCISGCIPVSQPQPTAPINGPQTRPVRKKGQKIYEKISANRLGNRTFSVDHYGKNVETRVGFGSLEGTKPIWAPQGYPQSEWVFVAATGGGQSGLIGLLIKKEATCIDGILEAMTTTPINIKGWVLAPPVTQFGSLIEVDECEVGQSPVPDIAPSQ